MIKFNTNKIIQHLSNTLKFSTWLLFAFTCTKITWWIIKPLGYNSIENPVLLSNNPNEYASSIANRAAFGVITTVIESSNQPSLADQIKLMGVYAAGVNNSLAFIQVSGQPQNVQIGDSVLNGKIIAITPNSIIINLDGKNVVVEMSSGNSTPNQPTSTTTQAIQTNNNISSLSNSDKDNQAATATSTAVNNSTQDNNDNSIADKRQKMIQAFQQQNNSSNN